MSMFKNPNKGYLVYSEKCSDRIVQNYCFDVSKYGEANVVKTDTTDIYATIQTYKDDCDLKIVLSQVRQSGDMSLLNKKEVQYGDMSTMPTTYIEAQNLVKKAHAKVKADLSKQVGIDFTKMTDDEFKDLDETKLQNILYTNLMSKFSTKKVENKEGE